MAIDWLVGRADADIYVMCHTPILPYPVIHYEEHIEVLAVPYDASSAPTNERGTMTGLFAPTIAASVNPRRIPSGSVYRLACLRLIILTVAVAAFTFVLAGLAQASVPPHIEHDITVIGSRNRTFVVPAQTTRAQLINQLRQHYGTAAPTMSRFTLTIARQDFRLTAAERNSLLPRSINFNHKADKILLAARTPEASVDANRAILRGLNARAVDRILERYRTETRVAPRDVRYVFNSSTRRLEVRAGRDGRVAPRPMIRRAIQDAMVQFAAQGYRGSVATRNVARTFVLTSDATTRRSLPRAILVVRSERRLFVYDQGRIIARYRVAVGRPGNATPRGDFLIGLKRRNPTWGNPGSAWARNMPQRIGPGPNNPLGVRALNLDRMNGRPTLLRIHGTSNTASIGRAASAGCIRLTNRDIVRLFNQIPSGTRVWIR